MSSSFVNSSHYISVANGVFLDINLQLNPNYENLTKELYAGEISRKPLLSDPVRSSYEINQWVQYATRNKIREIVSPEQVSNTPMVLASALYFKAKWETMFIEPDTRPRPYYINGRESPPTDVYIMATSGCFPFYEDKQLDVKIVGLPYEEKKSTMYIIMPNQSDRQKIRNLQHRIQVGQLNELINRMVVKTGTILMPKMKLESTLGLKDVLISEGLKNIFNPHLSNLTEITKDDRTLTNFNRLDQPLSTLSPIPITQNRPSPKPTTTTQPTYTQNFYNVNQRVPPISPPSPAQGNQAAPNPPNQFIPASDVPPTIQPIKVGLSKNDCDFTNNCIHDGNSCNCYPNKRIFSDDKGCYPRPFTMQQNCPPESQVYKDYALCLADSHFKYQIGGGQCAQNCEQLRDFCYCCKPPVPQTTQKVTTQLSSIDNQQNSNKPNMFEVENRFNPNVVSTPPPTRVCQTVRSCNRYGYECQIHTICALVNYKGTPIAENSNRRNKRQTQSSSSRPNLYVGDVLHKVTLDVNERGTEGGAVTAIVIDRMSSAFTMRVDGPFLIYLRNDVTKLPLFYGAVFDPRS